MKPMDMTPICEKCGKVAPIDKEKSTSNWTVYVINKPCKCGGEFTPRFILEEEGGME